MADVLIVVPTLGQRPDTLRSCLASLSAQTHPVRIAIVTTLSPAELASQVDLPIGVIVRSQTTRGLSRAINQGWHSDGWRSDFTGWLGDDDALPPWSVQAAVRALVRQPAASMVHGRCLVVTAEGDPVGVARNGVLGARLAGYGVNLLAQPGCLFRTAHLAAAGGLDEDLQYAMDVDLYVRLKRFGAIATAKEQLGVFRAHQTGLSSAEPALAYAESRMAMRRARVGLPSHGVDLLAGPLTRAVSRIARRLPPAPDRYWRPT